MRYRYSGLIVYNNFPWCTPTEEQKSKIEETAQAILDARAASPGCSLADLYDETTMTPELRKAHQNNDRAVMKAYGFPPILLLDDLFDKLDLSRAGNLLQLVAGHDFGQIFISDTDRNRSASLVDKITSDRAYFKASGGTFTQIDGQLQD